MIILTLFLDILTLGYQNGLQLTERSNCILSYLYSQAHQSRLSLYQRALQVQMHAVAQNTLLGYKAAAVKYLKFVQQQGWSMVPFSGCRLSQFMVFSYDVHTNKPDTIKTCLTNLKGFLHFFNAAIDDRDDEVKMTLEGLSRLDMRPTKHASPIQGHHLASLERSFTGFSYNHPLAAIARERMSPQHVQIMTVFTIAQNGMLRVSELVDLKWSDIEFLTDGLKIRINRSKAHQKGSPEEVLMCGHEGNHTNPVTWLRLHQHKYHETDSDWLFPDVLYKNKAISSSKFNLMIKKYAPTMELQSNTVSTHSFRSGGTTDLVQHGLPRPDVSRLGRWKSQSMVDLYYRPTDDDVISSLKASYTTMGK